jgi:hypothetical protein
LLAPVLTAELRWLLLAAWKGARPEITDLIANPGGVVRRIGETLAWSGPKGERVLGGLEVLAESNARIDAAVNQIETAQLAMQGALGVANVVSIATLGVTSLTGAFMALRLEALNKRIGSLAKIAKDIQRMIEAQHNAHLQSSVQFLGEYDRSPRTIGKLHRALDEARLSANTYGNLADAEAHEAVRLDILNCWIRFYVVSLLTEIRCLMSADESENALDRIEKQGVRLKKIAKTCFDATLKKDPERYLRASFQTHNVSLNMLASIYQQAKELGVIDEPEITDANSMFEHVRKGLQRGESYWDWLTGKKVDDEMKKLRYLLACLEETGRILGLQLMIAKVHDDRESLSELLGKLKAAKQRHMTEAVSGDAPAVFAYAF